MQKSHFKASTTVACSLQWVSVLNSKNTKKMGSHYSYLQCPVSSLTSKASNKERKCASFLFYVVVSLAGVDLFCLVVLPLIELSICVVNPSKCYYISKSLRQREMDPRFNKFIGILLFEDNNKTIGKCKQIRVLTQYLYLHILSLESYKELKHLYNFPFKSDTFLLRKSIHFALHVGGGLECHSLSLIIKCS